MIIFPSLLLTPSYCSEKLYLSEQDEAVKQTVNLISNAESFVRCFFITCAMKRFQGLSPKKKLKSISSSNIVLFCRLSNLNCLYYWAK